MIKMTTRGIALGAAFLAVACDPVAEPGGGSPSGSTSTPTATAETIPLNFNIWNDAGACWEWVELEVSAEHWQPWEESGCGTVAGNPPEEAFGTSDGQCIAIRGGFREGCEMEDPWVLDCSEVPGCCDAENETRDCPV
jgi:hypothetical protein